MAGLHRPRSPIGRQALGEADAFLERLLDFLVVERVARRIDQAAAIGDGDAAPAIEQLDQLRRLAGLARARARSARMARAWAMNSSAISRSRRRPARAHRRLAALGGQRLVALEEFLDLQRVIGQRLGRRVDGRQPAADHHRRQAELQIGDGIRSWRRR